MSQQNLRQEAEAKQEAPPNQLLQQSVSIAIPDQQQQAAPNATIDHKQQFKVDSQQQFKVDPQQQFKTDHQQRFKMTDELNRRVHTLESTNAQLQHEIEKWRRGSQLRDTEFTQIRQEKAKLESELSSMESRFGAAVNIRWSDNDTNSAYSLRKDLEKLDGILFNYTTLKKGVEINYDSFKPLLQKYKCRIKDDDTNDSLLQAALQRLIFEEVFAQADEYFQNPPTQSSSPDSILEREITELTRQLVVQLQTFVTSRLGTDKFSSIAPIRIRQISNAVLGSRGFACTSHPLVTDIVSRLDKTLSQYRKFTDSKKKATLDAKSNDL
ncbi:8149_t:CDS:1, partial [Paraglomus occultum]